MIKDLKEYSAAYYKRFTKWCFSIIGDSCKKCGSSEKLEIDHIDPSTKIFVVTDKMSPKYRQLVIEELKKCQPLCENCHAKKTSSEHSVLFQKDRSKCHGTLSQYMRYKCRCVDCRMTYSAWKRSRYNVVRNPEVMVRGPYKKAICGTGSMYRKGCRCDLCRNAERNRVSKNFKIESGQDGNAPVC